jgi:quinol monooxygenase YgiN
VPYIYEVTFSIRFDRMNELEIGHSLERVLGYLRAVLPNEHGFMTSRALYTIDDPTHTHVVFLSEWGSWEALERHRDSALVETKALSEFEPHITREDMDVRIYAEVGPRA